MELRERERIRGENSSPKGTLLSAAEESMVGFGTEGVLLLLLEADIIQGWIEKSW